jgi:hypothetical protein
MFGEIKKMLGIEDVKIDIDVPEKAKIKDGIIEGKVKLTTLTDSFVESINIKLIEKYQRGRNESKLIDEYTIGEITLESKIKVAKQDVIEIPFTLPFKVFQSEMDKFEKDNFILGGLASIAKKVKGVSSTYKIVAEGIVKGTKLQPLKIKDIKLS